LNVCEDLLGHAMTAQRLGQAHRAVARSTALAHTMNREWSSIPVTILTSRPSAKNALAVTSS